MKFPRPRFLNLVLGFALAGCATEGAMNDPYQQAMLQAPAAEAPPPPAPAALPPPPPPLAQSASKPLPGARPVVMASAPARTGPPPKPGKTGIPACDRMLEQMEVCAKKIRDPAGRDALRSRVVQVSATLRDMSPPTGKAACEADMPNWRKCLQ